MSGVDFEKLLSRPVEDAKRPPPVPAGTYFGVVKAFKFGEARFANDDGSKNLQVTFTVAPTRAGDDVDADTITSLQPALNARSFFADLPLSGGNEWITRMLLESLGIDVKRSWRECVPDALNAEVMFQITQRADKNNPEVMYNDIRNVRAAPQT